MDTVLNMALCGYGSLIHFFICFALAVFVYLRNPAKRLNAIYSLWAFNVGLWGIGTFVAFIMPQAFDPVMGFRMSMMGAVFIPALYVHFCLEHLRLTERYRLVILGSYFMGLILAVTSFTPWVVESVIAYPDNLRLPNPGILYHVFTGFFLAAILFALCLFVHHAKNSNSRSSRKKLWLHFGSSLIAYMGASSNILFMYGAPPLWLSWNIFLTLYVIAMAYAVINYRLWHIEYMVRQVVVFGVLGAIFLVCYFGAIYLLDFLVATHRRAHEIIASFFAFLIGYFLYRPLNDYLSDQSVFQRKYYYHKLLKDASRGMSNIESLEHLLKLVIHFVTMKMQIHNAAILSKNKETGQFHLQYQRGYAKNFVDYSLDSSDLLIEYLSSEREVLDIERIHDYMAGGYKGGGRARNLKPVPFEEIKAAMDSIGAICCVPSFLGRELKNILVLGEKKSGDSYTETDLTILYTLAQESAIAIENAGLYDEALRKTKELGNINEQLEYSKSLLMKALNETEVANKQLQDTQAQLIHEQKMATLGRLAASVGHEVNNPLTILSMNVSRAILKYRKNPDLRVGEILELFQKMEQNIARIKAVVNTLTGLLKRSEKGKFEPLSLKLILEETLPLVQFQTYLDNLTGTEVEFDVPGNIPLIRGDLERLQEVFLNLFINAYHAMAGKRNRRIQVKAHIDKTNPKQVRVEFADNGTGMSEETMKKIFNYGFTTKAPGKGSGLGLYMCKYIIELHGGSMRVESELGSGTTFVLTLPIYEEESTGSGDFKMEASS